VQDVLPWARLRRPSQKLNHTDARERMVKSGDAARMLFRVKITVIRTCIEGPKGWFWIQNWLTEHGLLLRVVALLRPYQKSPIAAST
ncbi:Hypothetical predicted protein, partial [Olea europaea subsp. europaea]